MSELIKPRSTNPGIHKFASDLARAAQLYKAPLGAFCKALTQKLYQNIVIDTPVDTGRARASWHVAVDEPDTSVPEDIPNEDKLARARARRKGEKLGVHPKFAEFEDKPPNPDLSEIDGTKKIFITSNLAYIGALEDGHSKQRPHGMVAVNVTQMEASIDAAIAAADKAK